MSNQLPESTEGLIVEQLKPEVQKPRLYKVILLNDDYTTMEFVVLVLERFFQINREKATQIMLHVHTRGRGICGVYTRELAETKVQAVTEYAEENQQPLQCTMEPD